MPEFANRLATVNRCSFCSGVLAIVFVFVSSSPDVQAQRASFELKIEPITSGTKHHFFGYIGQCQTIPWNASGRYVLGLEATKSIDCPSRRMPRRSFLSTPRMAIRSSGSTERMHGIRNRERCFVGIPWQPRRRSSSTTGMSTAFRFSLCYTTSKRSGVCASTNPVRRGAEEGGRAMGDAGDLSQS